MKFWFFKKKQEKHPVKTLLVHGYMPCGDVQVYERYWLLITYSDGSREVEYVNGLTLPYTADKKFGVYPRVKAWLNGEKIAKSLIVDLSTFEKKLESIVG